MIGKTISHYRILEQLGKGGMGVVYRAVNVQLDLAVAIKVLPASMLADEIARSRFRREARTLSQIHHPNIAIIHDFDSDAGVDFLVMEFVEGESLDKMLTGGPLAESEVVRLGMQIAEGLEAAHEKNIIHRDLKPGNVMVTPKGQVKILDFGLAKQVKPLEVDAATVDLAETQPGTIVGTFPYMAPEQLQSKTLDVRTDIYSLGAVLYEMATGRRAFPEKDAGQLMAAILTAVPQPPHVLNPQVGAGLEQIILRALEKDPEKRYQSAAEMRAALEASQSSFETAPLPVDQGRGRPSPHKLRWVEAATGLLLVMIGAYVVWKTRCRVWPSASSCMAAPESKIQSLAVLPLENLSRDPDQEYFADGMTDELITDLAQISALKVISRTSVMHYKRTEKTIPEIAKELHVDAIVEGSVQRSDGRVRITAQLVNAATDTHLWAKSYERDLRDVMALQDEVSKSIANEVQVTLTPEEQTRLASARPVNPQAHEAYLKGMYYLDRGSSEDVKTSRKYFEQAIAIDPQSALGYTGLSIYYGIVFISNLTPANEACAKAEPLAVKAIELDDNLGDAHDSLGAIKFFCHWDFAGAEREVRRGTQLNPSEGRGLLATILTSEGRWQEGAVEMKKAIQEHPVEPGLTGKLGWVYFMGRQYDMAIEQYRKGLELHPNDTYLHQLLGDSYAQKGMVKQAVSEYQRLASLAPDDLSSAVNLAYADAISGKRSEALKILEERDRDTKRPPIPAVGHAEVYIALGDKQKALDWLEKAYARRERAMLSLKVDPGFDSLRSEPRFQALLARMNVPN